ncbi:zinc-binding dehydrogenase [Thalassotalea marina]|uniref:Alcohol dehydrogenase n=1 Tax=Thalassotalea marina TaxID=1673741 RepID=A0A919BL29_9GAMM|nr:zinc-binding dehydrogenase [Thalassotalea marina]GHF95996.1 alcohol dehydrogenase [Thalassotalea marina]
MFTIPETMKAIVLDEAKNDFALSNTTLPIPEINEQQLLIKVEYAAINPVDAHLASTGCEQWHYPHIPLLDGVGTVVSCGCGHSPLLGQRVMWHGNLLKPGALAEYAVIESQAVAQIPDEIPAHIAACLPCAGLTAAFTLCTLAVQSGDKILIEQGGCAVSQLAIQIAKEYNLTVFTTADKTHHSYLKKLGADYIYDSNKKDLLEQIKLDLGHERFDHIIDSVGGDTIKRDIALLKFNGNVACLAQFPQLDSATLQAKSPSLHYISLAGAWLSNDICAQHKLGLKMSLLLEQVKNKHLCLPEVQAIAFNAQQVTEALQKQQQGDLFVKQVVAISA